MDSSLYTGQVLRILETSIFQWRWRCRLLIILIATPGTLSQAHLSELLDKEGEFTSKQDTALIDHVLKTLKSYDIIECLVHCMENAQCLSVNFANSSKRDWSECELNHASSPGIGIYSLIRRQGSTYYVLEKKNTVLLNCPNNGNWVTSDNGKSFCNCTASYSGLYCQEFRPKTCKHIQENGKMQDGEYDLYLKWPEDNRTAKIYCAEMNTETPFEYVTLTAGKANNFARHYNHNTRTLREETSFEKVRIELTDMTIVINDYRFATTTVQGVYKRFATASDCASSTCSSGSRQGQFKVDLSGTGFHLQESIQYRFYSFPSCNSQLFDPIMDTDRLRWSAKCGGFCGECWPTAIYLEFIG